MDTIALGTIVFLSVVFALFSLRRLLSGPPNRPRWPDFPPVPKPRNEHPVTKLRRKANSPSVRLAMFRHARPLPKVTK